MREIIGRIDTGLSVGAAALRERTEATDTRLRSLINRVEESLSVSRAAPPVRLQPPEKVEAPEVSSTDLVPSAIEAKQKQLANRRERIGQR